MFVEDMFGGFFGFWMVFPLGFLAIVALAIVAVATGRAEPEPDPEGRRAYGFYLSAVGLVTILVALFAATDAVGSLIASVVEKDEEFSAGYSYPDEFAEGDFFEGDAPTDEYFPEPPGDYDPDDERYVSAVRSGLIAAAAVAIYWLHRRRLDAVHEESAGRTGPAWQVHYGYLLAVAFLGVIVVLVAASDALFGGFRAIAPGITGFGEHSVEQRSGLTQLLRSGVLAGAGAFVFQWHWRRSQAVATPEPPRPQPELPPLPLDGPGEAPEPGVG